MKESHLLSRPAKIVFQRETINALREKAIETFLQKILVDPAILEIYLIGSSVKNSFGKYEAPGFRGSLYSDFDFIVIIKDEFKIPTWLVRFESAKPFSDDALNLAFRNEKFVDDTYDLEVFFIKESSRNIPTYCQEANAAGIPTSKESKIPHLLVYDSSTAEQLS